MNSQNNNDPKFEPWGRSEVITKWYDLKLLYSTTLNLWHEYDLINVLIFSLKQNLYNLDNISRVESFSKALLKSCDGTALSTGQMQASYQYVGNVLVLIAKLNQICNFLLSTKTQFLPKNLVWHRGHKSIYFLISWLQ